MSTDIEARVRQLEDRVLISEVVIKYCVAVDRRDWEMFADCFADTLHTDEGDITRGEFVATVSGALDGFTVTQHLSPNHLISFDENDPDRAVCDSYMYAQHLIADSPNGEFYLLRAWYRDHLVRTSDGWRIERIDSRQRWEDGNTTAVTEAIERVRSQHAE